MAKRKRYHHGKRHVDFYINNCNVKYFVLNQLFHGDKDAFINYMCSCISIQMYEGYIGHLYFTSGSIPFNLANKKNEWDEEDFQHRIKHARSYFRKAREF